MLKGRELAAFRKQLLAWFRQFQRDLPWRHTRDPYCVWLSEIMLQQTRVAAVIPYYERFLERFPNVQALAAAPEEEVLRVWELFAEIWAQAVVGNSCRNARTRISTRDRPATGTRR